MGSVAICMFNGVSAMYDAKTSKVVKLTSANFKKLVLESDEPWLVEFYAPWCGHCKSLAPEYKKVQELIGDIGKVGTLDMTEHREIGIKYDVKGFPTIKLFSNDKSNPIDYKGQRTAGALATFVKNNAEKQMDPKPREDL